MYIDRYEALQTDGIFIALSIAKFADTGAKIHFDAFPDRASKREAL